MPIIKLYNDDICQSLPPGAAKRRRAAIVLSYLTWPCNDLARNDFILEPLAPPIRPPRTIGGQSDLLDRHLNVAADRIRRTLDRKRITVEQRRLLEEASAALEKARGLVVSARPPVSEWEAAAEAANYFAGLDPGGAPHSRLRKEGRQALLRELTARSISWYLAGLQLFLCAQMHIHHANEAQNEASLRKAKNVIIERTRFNRDQLDKAWSAFKSVSPIAAGVIQIIRRRSKFQSINVTPSRDDLRLVIDGLVDDVAMNSVAFQKFAFTFISRRSKRSLLTESECWILPVANSPALNNILKPLHPSDLQSLVAAGRHRR